MADGAWRMFAHDDKGTYLHLGDEHFVHYHGLPYPIVQVDAREVEHDDPAGTHWGWLRAGYDEPQMIYPWRGAFDMCFPYGPAVEVEHGRGRIVRLAVALATEAGESDG